MQSMTMTTDMDELRFPIGDLKLPADFSAAGQASSFAAQIQTLRELPRKFSDAISGLEDSQLDTPYRPGGWTVRQLVHHVADSHANAYIRFKLALTEEWPVVKPYDEAEWAKLPDSVLPVEPSLTLLTALHLRWVTVLESMSDRDFERGYVHPGKIEDGGRTSLAEALATYDWHSRHHTAHITQLRQRMGW
jgi:hypothetical protein